MSRLSSGMGRTFRSLRVRNFRLYFFGQVVSASGTWMQSVGQAWLVLKLTGSGVALGTVMALQFTPMLLAGAWGGVIADRFDKRRVLIGAQASLALPAFALFALTATGAVRLWMVYALAFATGCVRVFDTPARQSFVSEMVGPENVANAVSLNSTVMTSARMVGPAIAGVLIASVGIAPCFLINGLSFAGVVGGLAAMDTSELQRSHRVAKGKGQLREGLRYVRSTPALLWPLVMMALIGTFAFNFQVLLPLMARFVFGAGARGYGALSSTMGAGAAVGALITASRVRPTHRFLIGSAFVFGLMLLGAAAAPTLLLEMAALVPVGAASIAFLSTANSSLQVASSPEMRGRVMALYSVLFLGSTPIGGPLMGFVAQRFGPRTSFILAAASCLAAGAIGALGLRRATRLRLQARTANA
jgi:MFS family permease